MIIITRPNAQFLLLDTRIWVWRIHGDAQLSDKPVAEIKEREADGLGVSLISCREVARLVERRRLILPCSTVDWRNQALAYPGIRLIDLTPHIAVESTQLPGDFHRDPADQISVATARVLDCSLLTADERSLNYPHGKTAQ